VVITQPHVLARVELGAALTNNNTSSLDKFAAEDLYAQHLWLRIAAVLGRAYAFLMSHDNLVEV
jgi:hypothetical protein